MLADSTLPHKLDVTLAFKAGCLMPELSATDRRVFAAFLDYFNRTTGRCDPSYESVAELLGVNRSTVIRATKRLVKLGLLAKDRHGGFGHRNSYQPNWSLFRRIEQQWAARKRTRSRNRVVAKLPPLGCQSGHLAGGEAATQTCSTNQSKETCSAEEAQSQAKASACAETFQGLPNKEKVGALAPLRPPTNPRSREIARQAALRRWDNDLLKALGAEHGAYAIAIEAIDNDLMEAATDAELRRRGTGCALVLERVASKTGMQGKGRAP